MEENILIDPHGLALTFPNGSVEEHFYLLSVYYIINLVGIK